MPTAASAASTRAASAAPLTPKFGAERDVLADGRQEQLVVGVLEHDADAPADLAQVRFRDR
jgi:hypothetical protein